MELLKYFGEFGGVLFSIYAAYHTFKRVVIPFSKWLWELLKFTYTYLRNEVDWKKITNVTFMIGLCCVIPFLAPWIVRDFRQRQ